MDFLLCRFPPRSGGGTPKTPHSLGFLDDEGYIGQRGEPGELQGAQVPSRRGQGYGRARSPPGHPVPPLWLLFCVPSLSFWKTASVDFQVIWRCSSSATQSPLFTAGSRVYCFGTGKLQTM